MTKPTIFFSHSVRDKNELIRLKELFVQKTGGSIDVFLSSDGQSIPLGRNWVHRIQEALENASLMIVFVSPNSLRSNWTFFESGYAYSKGIRVVPVGFLGVDLLTLPPPLSLLQGFNITSEEGLNNLIAVTNDAFGHSHEAKFTSEEYHEICLSSGVLSSQVFANYGSLIDNIRIELSQEEGLDIEPVLALDHIEEMLKKDGNEYTRSKVSLDFHGVSIKAPRGSSAQPLEISIDPGIADVSIPLVEKAIRKVRSVGINGIHMRLDFVPIVQCLTEQHKVTGRVYGSDVKLASDNQFIRQDIEFHMAYSVKFKQATGFERGATYLSMIFHCDEIPLIQIRKLLEFLFERGLLYLES
jgi:hypothetical protein